MINKKANPLLVKVEDAIKAKVPADAMTQFNKLVLAGARLIDSPQMESMVREHLKANTDPAKMAGEGAAKVVALLIAKAKGTPNTKALMMAAVVIMLEALDRLEELGRVKIDNDIISNATLTLGAAVQQMFGATPDKLQKLMADAQAMRQPRPQQPQANPNALIGARA